MHTQLLAVSKSLTEKLEEFAGRSVNMAANMLKKSISVTPGRQLEATRIIDLSLKTAETLILPHQSLFLIFKPQRLPRVFKL